jgi:hypothetical protein
MPILVKNIGRTGFSRFYYFRVAPKHLIFIELRQKQCCTKKKKLLNLYFDEWNFCMVKLITFTKTGIKKFMGQLVFLVSSFTRFSICLCFSNFSSCLALRDFRESSYLLRKFPIYCTDIATFVHYVYYELLLFVLLEFFICIGQPVKKSKRRQEKQNKREEQRIETKRNGEPKGRQSGHL